MSAPSVLRVGLSITQSQPELEAARVLLDRVAELDRAGFASIFVADHHLRTFDGGYLNPLVFLAALAQRTSRMELGQAMLLVPFYHPLLLAEQLATLDHVSQGRVVAGLGVGWAQAEFDAFNIPYDSRFRRFHESLDIIASALHNGVVAHHGSEFSIAQAELGARPYGGRRVPILLGGTGDRILRRVAQDADGWIASSRTTFEELTVKTGRLAQSWSQRGRSGSPRIVVTKPCCVRRKEEQARQEAMPLLAAHASNRGASAHPRTAAGIAEETPFVGSPPQILESLHSYAELGVTDVNLKLSIVGMPADAVWRSAAELIDGVLPFVGAIKVASR